MKISAFPAFKRKQNPYQILLYSPMQQKNNVTVQEFTSKNILLNKYDIIHIHWPESNKLRKTSIIAIAYIISFNLLLKIAKWKGSKVVWTVHNVQPHEKKLPLLQTIHFYFFTRLVDALIFMNRDTTQNLYEKYPSLKTKPFEIIPHGHYKNWYPNTITKIQARQFFKLAVTDKVFLLLGQLRPYKGVESLIEIFKNITDPSYKLIIAGKISKEESEYKDKLVKLINNNPKILFFPEFISDEQLQYYFNAADVVLLPYSNVSNSGVLLLALSFNTTIAMPYFKFVAELEKKYENWIITYKNLNISVLEEVLNRSAYNKDKVNDMYDEDWSKIATATEQFFESIR